jgi:hypothetical protein
MKKTDNKTKPNPPTIFSDDFKIGKLILGRVKHTANKNDSN